MTVDYLTADKVTYYQTGGTMEVDEGWFTNSTLYVYGGVLDDTKNSTQSLGNNVIYVQNADASFDPDALGTTFQSKV